jgi:hypothetical protein
MDANRVYGLLATASSEITMLRRQVDTLQPKAEAYDVIARMWRDPGKETGAWGVDVNFELQRAMEEIHAGFQREKEGADKPTTEKYPYPDEPTEKGSFDEDNLRRAMEDFVALQTAAAANMSGAGIRIEEADRPD